MGVSEQGPVGGAGDESHGERPVPVVFFHVMKCGGTSVRDGLTDGVAGTRHGPAIFELDGQAAMRAAGGDNVANWRFRDALLPYVLDTASPAIVLGHFRYRDRYAPVVGRAHFVTVLRDPVQRLVSLYRYRRYKAGVDLPVTGTFEDFVTSGRWAKEGHAYVDIFCGRDGLDPVSDEAVAAAVANLGAFAAVGFTDRLAAFAEEVGALVGKPVSIPVRNTSPAPESAADEISDEALELARKLCEPDYRVYRAVREGAPVGA